MKNKNKDTDAAPMNLAMEAPAIRDALPVTTKSLLSVPIHVVQASFNARTSIPMVASNGMAYLEPANSH